MAEYLIRTMGSTELTTVLGWAGQEGWRPGVADAGYFYPTDPQGFFLGLLDGEPIGSISGVKYSPAYGFIGLYIVKPDYRGQGFGMQLWQTAMAYLQGGNIGLDGVVAQQGNYQKSGFHSAYRHVRYQGLSTQEATRSDSGIRAAASVPFAQLLAYDSTLFPAPRPDFLKAWLNQTHGTALAVVREGRLQGFGVIRACHGGYRLGPLLADTANVAEALLTALVATLPEGSPFFMDIPEPNREALALAADRAMQPVFETARMYTQSPPNVAIGKLFAVTSLELG
jgi:GNAT superfamily N-acetyltransferase